MCSSDLGVTFLGVDEVGELRGVSDEEDWGVVAGHVPVAFLGVELAGETSGISLGIGGTFLASDGGETQEHGGSLADGVKELGLAELGDVVGHFEITMSTSTLGVDDSLRDSFTVEVGQLVDKVEVLEKDRAVFASEERILVVVDGSTGRGGQGVAGVVGH